MQLWAVQSKLKQEDSTLYLVEAFQNLSLNWAAFPVLPFKDFIPDFDWDGSIVYYGSVGLLRMAAARKHVPLFYDEETFKPEVYMKNFGDVCLNHGASFLSVKDFLSNSDEEFLKKWWFFRPNAGTKQFAGGVMSGNEMQNTAKYLISIGAMTEDDVICQNRVKLINKEYRTWIVNGEPIACVGYRQFDKVMPWKPGSFESKQICDFAKKCADRFKPSDIYVLDVANTSEDDLKLVEINCFHSAGFYLPDHVLDVVAEVSSYIGKNF